MFPNRYDAIRLVEIKKQCGIFLTDLQYAELCRLPSETIHILYDNRENLRQLMFFNKAAFNDLLQLSPFNMNSFFITTRFGAVNNVDTQLQALLIAQRTPVVIVAPPPCPSYASFGFPSVATMPSSMFYHQPMHGHHSHPSGPAMGHPSGYGMGPDGHSHIHGHP